MTGYSTIIDCHCHLYSPSIIASVSRREGLSTVLGMNMEQVFSGFDKSVLIEESQASGVGTCLLLPIAPAHGVHTVNRQFAAIAEKEPALIAAATLHPAAAGIQEEIDWLSAAGIRVIKLSSFTQQFDLEAEETIRLFEGIRNHNVTGKPKLAVLLDTFYKADAYFGSSKAFLTTPQRLGRLVSIFPEIDFIAAHMGGLIAPFEEIQTYLSPMNNLYLDTSNATHTLAKENFLQLLQRHGPDRILFGTDWPWFRQADEIEIIARLLEDAGFNTEAQSKIFGGNAARLLGLAFESCRG